MKAQTSLEFLLVLSAISALCLTAVLLYGRDIRIYSVNQIQANSILLQHQAYGPNDNSSIIAYINGTSIAGEANPIYMVLYGCNDGYANITISSNASSILNTGISTRFHNILPVSDYFTPHKIGPLAISLAYSLICNNSTSRGSYTLQSFSENATSNPPTNYQGVSASMTLRNESITYNTSSQQIYNIGQDSGCTAHDFFGNPLSAAAQCGTADAWDYMIFSSSCYTNNQGQTSTYCIYPDQTGYVLHTINPAEYSYVYSFSLAIYNGTNAYSIHINSTQSTFPVYLNGDEVGVANVVNVYSQQYVPNFAALSNSSYILSVNTSYQSQYEQAMQSAFATLAFYNSTRVGGATQSAIEQQISAFNKTSSQLLHSTTKLTSQCKVYAQHIECDSIYPLDYQINVTITKGQIPNSTINLQGSQILIKS